MGILSPLEKAEAHQCDKLVRLCGGEIVCFSQPRETMQTEGIPDRRYRVFGVCFWFEVKSQDDGAQLTADQADYLRAESDRGCPGACGSLYELTIYLPEVRRGNALKAGRTIVDRWITKGFRSRSTRSKRRNG